MVSLGRALIFTSAERYIVLIVNFFVLTIVSRLMTPEEIGLAVVGSAFYVMAQSLREFGTTAYLVQQKILAKEAARSAFTFCLATTVIISGSMLLFSGTIASFYKDLRLSAFIQILGIALTCGTITAPIAALMQRDMQFPQLATVNTIASVLNAAVTIILASKGFGFVSFAWGHFFQSATTATLLISIRRDFWVFRPSFKLWRSILSFGGYLSITYVLNRTCEQLPNLLLGRALNPSSVGLFSRATMICDLPLKGVLQGIFPIILPALAVEAREGRCLKTAYLRAISYITALQWPGLLLLFILAHPIVAVLLGSQWVEVVPLVRIVTLATLFSFPGWLTFPMLVTLGQLHDLFVSSAVALAITGIFIYFAAKISLVAVCLALLLTIPIQNIVAVWFVRKHVPFAWSEFFQAVKKSAVVSGLMFLSSGALLVLAGFRSDPSVGEALLVGLTAAVSWYIAMLVTRHPLLAQITSLLSVFPNMAPNLRPLMGKYRSKSAARRLDELRHF